MFVRSKRWPELQLQHIRFSIEERKRRKAMDKLWFRLQFPFDNYDSEIQKTNKSTKAGLLDLFERDAPPKTRRKKRSNH